MSAQSEIGTDIVISRIFDAPVEKVWKAWTEPEQVMLWWGPANFTSPTCKIDFRVGGKYLFCMRSPDGKDYWSTGQYKEIIPLQKIVKTDSFADEKGNVVPSSYYDMPGIPDELTITLLFEDQGSKTKLTIIHSGFPEGDHRTMADAGWNESIDKLEKVVNKK